MYLSRTPFCRKAHSLTLRLFGKGCAELDMSSIQGEPSMVSIEIESTKKREIEVSEKPIASADTTVSTSKCNAKTYFQDFCHSFKRKDSDLDSDVEAQDTQLSKTIKSRHLLMISLGTGIATGLLVGNGQVLAKAGPAGLIIGYTVSSIMIYCIIHAAGELGICYRGLVGNFTRYPSILIDPSLGFAISLLYTLQWLTVLPLQLVTAAITISFWTDVNPDIFVLCVFIVVIIVNLFGARGYAETEFFCNCCKILMITGFIILSIVIITGGAGKDGYIGAKYWIHPGPFAHGFKGCLLYTSRCV